MEKSTSEKPWCYIAQTSTSALFIFLPGEEQKMLDFVKVHSEKSEFERKRTKEMCSAFIEGKRDMFRMSELPMAKFGSITVYLGTRG